MNTPNSPVSNERLVDALKPFADAVFNDNGDMTVNYSAVVYDDYVRAYFALRSLSTGTDAGVRVTVAEALRQLSSAIEAEGRDQARRDEMLATLIVNIEKAEPTAELAAALRDFVREERPKLSALEQQPAASQEGARNEAARMQEQGHDPRVPLTGKGA